MTGLSPYGMTFQLQVGDLAAGRAFYTALFDGPPQFEPAEDLLEWAVVAGGEIWLQVVGVQPPARPLLNRLRFGVRDLPAAREALIASGVEVSPAESVPGVVAFCDFADPWDNRLGLYQDLAAGGEQPA